MPDVQPAFLRGFFNLDLFTGATLVYAAYVNSALIAQQAMSAIEPATATVLIGTGLLPDAILILSDNYVVLVVAGTDEVEQWIGNVLGSGQVVVPPIPGQVAAFFGLLGVQAYNAWSAAVLAQAAGKRIVVIGHSLGGAIAQCFVAQLLPNTTSPVRCFTYGCPRVGDPVFAASFPAVTIWRLEDVGDPFPSLPPVLWAGVGSSYPIPGPPPFATYTHAGNSATCDLQGNIANGETSSITSFIVNVLNGSPVWTPHTIEEYSRRLQLQLPPAVLQDPVYEDPPEVVDAYLSANITPSPMVQESTIMANPTNKVTVFYNFLGKGPSESWLTAASADSLKGANGIIQQYVNARMMIATSSFTAVYARISLIGSPRVVDFYVPTNASKGPISLKDPNPPQGGYFSGPDSDPDEALLLRIQTAGGVWTRMWLHAFPAVVEGPGGAYTPTKAWNTALQNYVNFLTGNVGQMQWATTNTHTPAQRVPIQAITALPGRGQKIAPVPPAAGQPPVTLPTVGQKVLIGGAGAKQVGMDGRKICTFVSTDNSYFLVGGASPVGSTMAGEAYYVPLTFSFGGAKQAQVERIGDHKVGKVIFFYPGRRANTIPLRQ